MSNAPPPVIADFRLTRFQLPRSRAIGDSQVRVEEMHALAVELIAGDGTAGLGFAQALFDPFPAVQECRRVFSRQIWPELAGARAAALIHRVACPRGGNRREASLGLGEAVQVALWDLAARQAGMALHHYLGATRESVPAYASGLDFHLDDAAFTDFFAGAAADGFTAFKVKLGHPDFARDLHRLDLLRRAAGDGAGVMIDANEAWGAKEAIGKVRRIREAGHRLIWVEDPIPRDDLAGLCMMRRSLPDTMINSGEYLDAAGRRRLIEAGAVDILPLHGRITDAMRLGWLAREAGVPVALGNTFAEIGVHVACALPGATWLEYSYIDYARLLDRPVEIRAGRAHAPPGPGHGLELSESARRELASDAPDDRAGAA